MKKTILFTFLIAAVFIAAHMLFRSLFITCAASMGAAFIGLSLIIKDSARTFSKKIRITVYALFVLSTAIFSIGFVNSYLGGLWQQDALLDVGGVIGMSTLQVKLEDISIKTIKEYYYGGAKGGRKISEAFNSLYPLKKNNPAVVDTIDDGSVPKKIMGIIYMDSISDNKIVLVGKCIVFRGIDHNFQNYSGGTGKVQSRITITPAGRVYEIQN